MAYPNRYICAVFDEMRDACKTSNYSYLPGLIEEAQTMANRMEAALGDKGDIRRWNEERSELNEEIKKLRKKRDKLLKETGTEKKQRSSRFE